MAEPAAFPWKPDPEFSSANQAEHAIIGGYELVAFDLPSTVPGVPHIIGWELFTGPDLHELVDKGDAVTFEVQMRRAVLFLSAKDLFRAAIRGICGEQALEMKSRISRRGTAAPFTPTRPKRSGAGGCGLIIQRRNSAINTAPKTGDLRGIAV